jgi:c-di-GMP-related signal transduction protein
MLPTPVTDKVLVNCSDKRLCIEKDGVSTFESGADIFVARQPIFDAQQNLFAYELLYRSSMSNAFDGVDDTQSTLDVIRNAFLILGAQLTGSKKVFINFNRHLLKNRKALVLNPQTTVIEILEGVEADGELIEACQQIKDAGYTLAIDDFDLNNTSTLGFIRLADLIKIDFRLTTPEERQTIVLLHGRKGLQFLAEKVETFDEFEEAKKAGYAYFQGYFFGKPVIISARNVPGYKMNYLRLLTEVNKHDLSFPDLTKIIMQDTFLSYTLLNYLNSAYFALRGHVDSISQALVLLGEQEVRKWASLVALTFVGEDKPSEVLVTSLIRARFCELVAQETGLAGHTTELFMMGMLSMLDVLVGRPLEELLEKIHVSHKIREALGDGNSQYSDIFRLILDYERADWQRIDAAAEKHGLDRQTISFLYLQAVEWTDQAIGNRH